MTRRLATRHWVFAAAALMLAFMVSSDASGPRDKPGTFRSESRLVLLDVSVRDRRGSFVEGLAKQDFSVVENGRTQEITVFDHNDAPVTVGILVDESWSMTPKRAEALSTAQAFIGASNLHDEMFILNFNDWVRRGLPAPLLFSDNVPQLRSALFQGVPEGKTALYDAVAAGLNQLELGQREKKALVVISDGGDNTSKTSRRDMLAVVERSTATIYTIGLFDPQDPDSDPGILLQLARISGGECYLPHTTSEMAPVCRRIAQDIRERYTVGYVPRESNGGGSLRRIAVRLAAPDRRKLTIRTRTSYHFDEPENQEKKLR